MSLSVNEEQQWQQQAVNRQQQQHHHHYHHHLAFQRRSQQIVCFNLSSLQFLKCFPPPQTSLSPHSRLYCFYWRQKVSRCLLDFCLQVSFARQYHPNSLAPMATHLATFPHSTTTTTTSTSECVYCPARAIDDDDGGFDWNTETALDCSDNFTLWGVSTVGSQCSASHFCHFFFQRNCKLLFSHFHTWNFICIYCNSVMREMHSCYCSLYSTVYSTDALVSVQRIAVRSLSKKKFCLWNEKSALAEMVAWLWILMQIIRPSSFSFFLLMK